MGFYNFYKIFKDILQTIFGYKNFRRLLILLLILVFCFAIFDFNTVFGATDDNQLVFDFFKNKNEYYQNMFVIHSIYPYVNNTDYWNNYLSTIWKDVATKGLYISVFAFEDTSEMGGSVEDFIRIYQFPTYSYQGTSFTDTIFINGTDYTVNYYEQHFNSETEIIFNVDTNIATVTTYNKDLMANVPVSFDSLFILADSVTQFSQFINSSSGGGGSSTDYTQLLNIINNSLNSINSNISNLDGDLANIESLTEETNNILNTIKSKLDNQKDYTDQLNTVNQSLQNLQNTYQEQQEQTRQQISDSTNQITNTLTDNNTDNIDTSDLQNQDTTQDITQDGFNSIFTTIQNAFLDDTEKSIELKIPFTNKSFILSKSTIYGDFSLLSTIETFANMIWYFLVSLFIVKNISKKINKIKSGDIDNIQNDNIKEDLL